MQQLADDFLTPPSKWMGMCGHGKRHNWSVVLADMLFVNCACCLIWRGFFIGLLIGALIVLAIMGALYGL
jgi:hypothetical protein